MLLGKYHYYYVPIIVLVSRDGKVTGMSWILDREGHTQICIFNDHFGRDLWDGKMKLVMKNLPYPSKIL